MRKTIFLLTSLCVLQSVFAQEKTDTIYYNRNWDETTRELAGYYRLQEKVKKEDTTYWKFADYYMDNDQLQNEGFLGRLRPEKRIGYWKWYFQNGKPKMEGNYDDNRRVGEWKHYHTNGVLKKIGGFTEDGERDGQWKWYHDDSSLMSHVEYKKDTLLDERTWYFENGQERKHEFYNEKGRVDSTRKEWYSTGKLKSEVNYTDGFKNGEERNYYLDAGLKSIIQFKTGINHDEDDLYFSMAGDTVPKDSVVDEKEFHNLLWKIEGNGVKKASYLFGTMHVKNKEAFEFSDSMLTAFNNAEGYTMEIHPDSLYAHYFQQYDKDKSMQNFGSEVIGGNSPEDYFDSWEGRGGYNKWIMNLNEIFHRDTYNPEGMPYFVDCYLYYIAKKQGKYTDGIERVKDHVNAGKDLPRNDLDYDILRKMNPAQEMLDTYQQGHLKKINALMELLQNEEFRYRLLTVRNIKMAEAIDSLAQIRSTFNTAGTAHLPGDDGVIELLRQKGYTLTPVKAIFSGDSLDYTVNNIRYDWKTVTPYKTDFTVDAPGRMTAFNAGDIRNVFLDPIKEIGLDAFQLDDRFLFGAKGKTKVLKEDLDYLTAGSEVTSREKISHNGYKGIEVFFTEAPASGYYSRKLQSKDKGNIYNRMRVFKKDFRVYVINVASTSRDSLYSGLCKRYISSLKLPEINEEQTAVLWSTFTDTLGAFSINTPENRKYKFLTFSDDNGYYGDDDNKDYRINYWTSVDGDDKFSYRYSNSPLGTMYYNDSLVLAKEIQYYEESLGEVKDSSHAEVDGYPAVRLTFKPNKKHLVKLQVINRGYRFYVMVAQIKNEKESIQKADVFFDSFKFETLRRQELVEYVTEIDSLSFMLPKGVDVAKTSYKRWFVPKRELKGNTRIRYSSYEYGVHSFSSSEDESYVEPAKPYRNRMRYFAIDSVSGISYQTFVESFSEHYYLPNRDTLFNYYSEIFHQENDSILTSLFDTIPGSSTMYTRHDTYFRPVQNTEFQMKFSNVGPNIVIQRVSYPHELKNDPNINAYFNETDFSSLSDTVNLFEDKAHGVLENLMSKDSATQVKARQSLSFYPFDSTHVPLFQEYAMKEMGLDTNDIENNAFQLIHLMSYYDDSSNVQFLSDFYDKYSGDSLELKFKLIKELSEYKDSIAIKNIVEFVSEDSLQYSYRTDDEYNGVLEYFEDSLQLYANNFSAFHNWMNDTLWRFETQIHKVTLKALEQDSLDRTGIENEFDSLKQHYYWVTGVYDSLDKDSSIFYQVKTNVKVFTEVMGSIAIQDDSLKAIFLKLIDDKDDDIRLAASKALFRNGDALDKVELNEMLSGLSNRYKLMQVLAEINKIDLVPREYLAKERLAESQAFASFSKDKYSYHRSSEPVKLSLLKKVTRKIDGEKYEFYVYTYYKEDYRRVKKIGVSNPFALSERETQIFPSLHASEETYSKEDKKSLIKTVVDNWVYDYLDSGEWSEETAEEVFEF